MSAISQKFYPILAAARTGELPPRIALMRLAIEASSPEELAAVLEGLEPAGDVDAERRISELRGLAAANPGAFATVKAVIRAVVHGAAATDDPAEHVAALASMFDRAATASPEASVALYSLGDAAELASSADEVSAYLVGEKLVGPDSRVLEIGCGIGRFIVSLAPYIKEIVGTDISAVMVAEARQRIAHLPNASAQKSSGLDLAEFADGSFDAVLALDSFPYVMDAGGALPQTLFVEASRVLSPGGAFVICNFSYRGDAERDRQDAESFGRNAGLTLVHAGERPFRRWDGTVFSLRKS